MNATDLLEQQHRKVEEIFDKLGDMSRDEGQELLHELATDLAAHMTIEHELFYPAVRELDEELIHESFEEHSLAEVALKRLLSARTDATFKARVTALKELIEHHVEEEEHELFPKAQKNLDDERLDQLGEEMEQRFEEAVESGFKKLIPKGVLPATSADEAQKPRRSAARRKASTSRRSTSTQRSSRRRKAA